MTPRDTTSQDGDTRRERRLLLQGLAVGALAAMLPAVKTAAVMFTPPVRLPPDRSVYRVNGQAWVNDKPLDERTRIVPGDTVKTAPGSELVFAVGDHAMLLRGGSHLVIHPREPGSLLIAGLNLIAGKLLSASRNKGMRIDTPSATVGIRGTGVYLETSEQGTYFCTCYGEIDIAAAGNAASQQVVHSVHHDRPLYVEHQCHAGQCVHDAPHLAAPNHSDAELRLLEALVGRVPQFDVRPV